MPQPKSNPKHSTFGQTRVFTSPADPAPKDRRSRNANASSGGSLMCPRCGGEAALVKANTGQTDRARGIRVGDIVIGNHRHGGGRYSARNKRDILCAASLLTTTEAAALPARSAR